MRVLVSDFTPSPFGVTTELTAICSPPATTSSQPRARRCSPAARTWTPRRASPPKLGGKPFRSAHPVAASFTFGNTGQVASVVISQFVDRVNAQGELSHQFSIPEDLGKQMLHGTLSVEGAVHDDRGKYVASAASADFIAVDRLVGLKKQALGVSPGRAGGGRVPRRRRPRRALRRHGRASRHRAPRDQSRASQRRRQRVSHGVHRRVARGRLLQRPLDGRAADVHVHADRAGQLSAHGERAGHRRPRAQQRSPHLGGWHGSNRLARRQRRRARDRSRTSGIRYRRYRALSPQESVSGRSRAGDDRTLRDAQAMGADTRRQHADDRVRGREGLHAGLLLVRARDVAARRDAASGNSASSTWANRLSSSATSPFRWRTLTSRSTSR